MLTKEDFYQAKNGNGELLWYLNEGLDSNITDFGSKTLDGAIVCWTEHFDPGLLDEMRTWVVDCSVDDDDEEERIEASDISILRWVRRNYEGGIEQFIIGGQ